MKNTLKLNHADRTIVMDKTFAKFALDTRTDEYKHLQEVRRDYLTILSSSGRFTAIPTKRPIMV